MSNPSEEHFEVVSLLDPAIDLDESNVYLYRASRDQKHLVFHDVSATDEEGEPIGPAEVYVLRGLSTAYVHDVILANPNAATQLRIAFQACLVEVRNFHGDPSRGTWKPERVSAGRVKNKRSVLVTDEELELFDPLVVEEIGEVAKTRLFTRKRRRALKFELPHSWQWLLGKTPDLAAALIRDMPDQPGTSG